MDYSRKYNGLLKTTFLSAIILFAGMSAHAQDSAYNSDNLDGINQIPEWLLMQVEEALPSRGLNVWVPSGTFQTSSLKRVPRFPNVSNNIEKVKPAQLVELQGIQNEQLSAQLAVAATDSLTNLQAVVGNLESENGNTIETENIQTRFVKYVPVHKSYVYQTYKSDYVGNSYEEVAGQMGLEGVSGFGAPDVVADPIIDVENVDLPMLRAQPIWFTIKIPKQTQPGIYNGEISIQSDQYEEFKLKVKVRVRDYTIPDPKNYKFKLDVWLNPFAIADYYNVKPWSEAHWQLISSYFDDVASRGQKVIMTPIIEEPWKYPWRDGKLRSQTYNAYKSLIKWRLQENGEWNFDYSVFDKYVQKGLDHGNGPYISAYSMLVFRGPQRLTYFDEQKQEEVIEYLKISDERFEEVWRIFLEDFSAHLEEKGWLDQTYLSFDERPESAINIVSKIVKESAPELYQNQQEGMPRKAYYMTCCSALHPNRYSFSPAVESYLIPWVMLNRNLDGYLDWAYNSWPKDVFNFPVFLYPQGDEYFVYPGSDGPMTSIRWELLKDGIEDYELIKVLKETGALNNENEMKSIELMTRELDGRIKNLKDIIDAKQMLFDK